MALNVNQALKKKNALTKDMVTQQALLIAHNTYKTRNKETIEYDTKAVLNNFVANIGCLVETKAAIARANHDVWPKIFRLAELKGLVSTLKQIPVKQGIELESTGYGAEAKEVEYKATLTHTDIDKKIKEFENEMERLQDDLDKFNFTTEVPI